MDKKYIQEYADFKVWWEKCGYHYTGDPDEEIDIGDLMIEVSYWAWKAWVARAGL